MIHDVVAMLFGFPTLALAQQVVAPVPAPTIDSAGLSEGLLTAIQSPMWSVPVGALRQAHGDVAVLDGLLEAFERHDGALAEAHSRANAFDVLLELVAEGTTRETGHDARVADVLLGGLSDPLARKAALTCSMHVAPEEQRRLVPAIIPLLDDTDPRFVAEVCRVLGKFGSSAESALPRLKAVLVAPARAPVRPAHQQPGHERAAAAEARMVISGEVGVDADLYPTLDAEGQRAVAWPVAMMLARMGVPDGAHDAQRIALAGFYLDRLGDADLSGREGLTLCLSLPRLMSDETDASIRDRARQFLEASASGGDEQLAAFAKACLDPPEVPYEVDEAPPTDARVDRLFRPRSNLITAAETARGLLAVSLSTRDARPTDFPPQLSMLHVWDAEQGTLLQRVDGLRGEVLAAVLVPDGSRLIIGTRGSQPARPADGLVVCALDGKTAPAVIPGHEAGVRRLVLAADGQRAASIGDDGAVRLTDLAAASVLHVWESPEAAQPTALAMRADGQRLVVGAADLSLRLYDLGSFACLATGTLRDPARPEPAADSGYAAGHPWLPSAVAFLPDGERLLVGDMSGRLLVWDPRSVDPPTPLAETGVAIAAIALSSDGQRTLTSLHGTWSNKHLRHPANFTLKVWETGAGEPLTTLTGMWMTPSVIAFLDDDQRVLGMSSGALRTWRLEPR